MNIEELEYLLKKEDKLRVVDQEQTKRYIRGDDVYYDDVFHNMTNVFGISKEDDEYVFFMTDGERGIQDLRSAWATEYEACEDLYEYITLLKESEYEE